jgi:biuret amidohydrolase
MLRWGTLDIAETLDELVRPSHTALLMWDYAAGLVSRAFNRDAFVTNSKLLLDAARASGIPVLYSRQSDMTWPEVGPGLIRMRMKPITAEKIANVRGVNRPGTVEGEFAKEVAPADGDIVFHKFMPNGFLGSDLEWRLRARGIRTLVFGGISLETGVDTTAREALHRGYYAVIAGDACSSSSKKRYDLSTALIHEIHDVYSATEIADAWRKAAANR